MKKFNLALLAALSVATLGFACGGHQNVCPPGSDMIDGICQPANDVRIQPVEENRMEMERVK